MPTVVWGGAAAGLPALATTAAAVLMAVAGAVASVAAGEVVFGPDLAGLLGELLGPGPRHEPDYSTKLRRVRRPPPEMHCTNGPFARAHPRSVPFGRGVVGDRG